MSDLGLNKTSDDSKIFTVKFDNYSDCTEGSFLFGFVIEPDCKPSNLPPLDTVN